MFMKKLLLILLGSIFVSTVSAQQNKHQFDGEYTGENLNQIAFPMGGIGSGMITLDGTGSISHFSIKNRPDLDNEPYTFAAIMAKGDRNTAKVLQTLVPMWKTYNRPNAGEGGQDHPYGLPRFRNGTFQSEFPFATLKLEDDSFPAECSVTGWSPFIPNDADNSSLPVAVLEYKFKNTTGADEEYVFSWHSRNVVQGGGVNKIMPAENGFTCATVSSDKNSPENTWFTASVDDNNAVVDYVWFRGGWFDGTTLTWKNIVSGNMPHNPPIEKDSPGASIYVPFKLKPGEEKSIRLTLSWYSPNTNMKAGVPTNYIPTKNAVKELSGQGRITRKAGNRMYNSFGDHADSNVGELKSKTFQLEKDYVKLLVGGGLNGCGVELVVDGKTIYSVHGKNKEHLEPVLWDVKKYKGEKAHILAYDHNDGPWGHILMDQIIQTDNAEEDLYNISSSAIVIEDFEDEQNDWEFINILPDEKNEGEEFYKPWYAGKFKSIDEVNNYLTDNIDELYEKTKTFSKAFYSCTLPDVVIEAVAANLSILKSPTVLRQADGTFWAWEGSGDNRGLGETCTHVWNYAQAVPHLFPELERTLRETEFFVNQNEAGHQNFRTALPAKHAMHKFHAAADGQLGGIMKVYREWRISGNTEWMKKLYPKVKESIDYCIEEWDPRHKGVVEEPHHNTYDIEFWGADGMITSFYLGALNAFVKMSDELDEPFSDYQKLLAKGKKYLETKLFNGEYFYQDIEWKGLNAPDPVEFSKGAWNADYSPEAIELLKKEGPKYQYGTGCLSDGVLGMWMSDVCSLNEVVDEKRVKSHLNSVYKYNFKTNLMAHANAQRPNYFRGDEGGTLLCTWPRGEEPTLPLVYANEVWTGIEYQVASHLIMHGEVEKGLNMVKETRKRYNGHNRNPYDEIEWGHWYARAMSSYSLLQALTGVRYDAVTKTLYIDSKIGNDFTSFLSVDGGFGNVGLKNGKPFIDFKSGSIDVKKVIVSGNVMKL